MRTWHDAPLHCTDLKKKNNDSAFFIERKRDLPDFLKTPTAIILILFP